MTLARLIEAVDAGAADWYDFPRMCGGVMPYEQMECARSAYNGSIDAAKRLHDALLPERYGIALQYCQRYAAKAIICDPMDGQNWQSGDEWVEPARAWLLAILRAMEGRDG